MVRRNKLFKDPLFRNCLKQDQWTKEFTHSLHLTLMRSTGNRSKDYRLAHKHWECIVIDGQQLEIHHCLDGWVGLIPKDLHRSLPHKGYIARLGLSA